MQCVKSAKILLYDFLSILSCKYSKEPVRQNERHLFWKPPPEDRMKINIDTSRIQSKGSASLGYVMRYNQTIITIEIGKQMGACPILVAECLTV